MMSFVIIRDKYINIFYNKNILIYLVKEVFQARRNNVNIKGHIYNTKDNTIHDNVFVPQKSEHVDVSEYSCEKESNLMNENIKKFIESVTEKVDLVCSGYNEELKYKRKNNLLKKKINALEKIQLLQEVFIAENINQNETSNISEKPSNQLTVNQTLITENNNWKQKVYELLVQSASSDELHINEINRYKTDINNYSEELKLKKEENITLQEKVKALENELESIRNENMVN
ncbi:hypothetical protein PIROE2DRAFT_57270 [Piromyces sp. E2]|nr:hypothetical protein PIROE2DRAFT_57270 [Piromyces sp. E2]|eukprot:OUM69729.1 hypothetical protein PIROE2DRAFT_57270 [Piromyces sp. E2]